jgi:23S rRNA (uridine2479-2'-O)-methyltransferase
MPPQVKRIFSENNDFQYAETLRRNRQKRHRQGEFFVEGVRPINQALAHGWTISAFLYSHERSLSGWAGDILARSTAQVHYELPQPLMDKLSQKDEPSELLALVRMPPDDLARIPLSPDLCVVVLDRPASPGNLGSIIRSCDAFGVHGVIVTGHAADVYDPETIRATTGSLFAVPVVRLADPPLLVPWLARAQDTLTQVQVVGSSAKARLDIIHHDFRRPTVLVVGNETWGMSTYLKELCDAVVRIPIVGSATSLNVASATSIMLYEIARQRRQ